MADPVINPKIINENSESNGGVFGGGEDIFDNEELFHSMETKAKIKNIEDELLEENNDIAENNHEDAFNPFDLSDEKDEIVVESEKAQGESQNEEEVVVDEEVVEETKDEEIEELQEESQEIKDKNQDIEEIEELEEENNEEENNEEEISEEGPSDDQKIEYEPEEKSDLIKKFEELVEKIKQVYEVADMSEDESIEILGGDNGISKIMYDIRLIKNDDESVLIKKTESNQESQEEDQNILEFKKEQGYLEIILDEHILYNEEDIADDESKKMVIIDKLNKFIFLVEEELKIYEKQKKEKQMMEEERRKLKDIFRNF